MTDRISGNDERRSLPAEEFFDLQAHIARSSDLAALLDLFGEEIEKLALIDGYLINLRDAETKHLISLKVRLTPEFRSLEETYHRYTVALSGDALSLNARVPQPGHRSMQYRRW